MNIPHLALLLLLIGSSLLKAQPVINYPTADQALGDLSSQNTPETVTSIVKNVVVDVQQAPVDGHVMVSAPITVSLSTETLNLQVHSTKWPNEYPYNMGFITAKGNFNNYFKVSHPEALSSILKYQDREFNYTEDVDNTLIQPWTPVAVGSVKIPFYGDLIIKEGSLFQAEKVRHVIVEVPVTVIP